MAQSPNGTFPIKQMQDEEGNPFYPLTIMALICGTDEQKSKLQSVGANIRQIDLSEYLYITSYIYMTLISHIQIRLYHFL